jgi:hypothetical protein
MNIMNAFKVEIIESERGWGSKVDDYMICLSQQDAELFKEEFNSFNISVTIPEWYMAASSISTIELNDAQLQKLNEYKRIYWSQLKKQK